MYQVALANLRPLKRHFVGLSLLGILLFFDPTDLYLVYKVAEPGVRATDIPTAGYLTLGTMSWFALFLSATALFGRSILRSFWMQHRSSVATTFIASFWAGYLGVVAVFRIFSLYFVPGSAVKATLAVVLLLFVVQVAFAARDGVFSKVKFSLRTDLFWIVLFPAWLIYVVISQVTWGDFAWVGHGSQQYLWFVSYFYKSGEMPTLPLFKQHCDEILYMMFLMQPLNFNFDPVLAGTIVLALNKISTVVFAYHVFRVLKARRLLSASLAGFLFLGQFGLNPFLYVLSFDSSNPLLYAAHSGRTVGLPFSLYVLASFLRLMDGKAAMWNLSALALLGFGISTTSISNITFLVALGWLGFAFAAVAKNPAFPEWISQKKVQQGMAAAFILAFSGIALAYLPAFVNPDPLIRPGSTLLLTTLAMIFFVLLSMQILRGSRWSLKAIGPIGNGVGALTFGISFCAVFYANMFIVNPINVPLLEKLQEWTGIRSIAVVEPFNQFVGGQADVDGFFLVDVHSIGDSVQYAADTAHFVFCYGSLLVLMLVGCHAVANSDKRSLSVASRFNFLMLVIMFFMICTLLFYVDFVNDAKSAWIKTRFVELPVYLFFTLFGLQIHYAGDRLRERFFSIVFIVWSVVPFLATERLSQWLLNLATFRKMFGV